jgi:hypothetical protein
MKSKLTLLSLERKLRAIGNESPVLLILVKMVRGNLKTLILNVVFTSTIKELQNH